MGSIKNTLLSNLHSADAISFDWHQAEAADGAHTRKGRVRMGIITHKASVVRFPESPPLYWGCDVWWMTSGAATAAAVVRLSVRREGVELCEILLMDCFWLLTGQSQYDLLWSPVECWYFSKSLKLLTWAVSLMHQLDQLIRQLIESGPEPPS